MTSCSGVWAPKGLSIFTTASSVLFTLTATVGNALIIIVVVKDPLRKLRSPFLYFIVNLAISDLIVGVITMPISVYNHTTESLDIKENKPLKRRILHLSFFISVTASILNLMALSIDRYIAITFPLKYRKYLSWRKCWITSAGIWLFSLTVPFVYIKIGFIDYLMAFASYGILSALIILVVTYVRIYKFLRGQTADLKKQLRTTSTAAEEFRLKRLIMERKVTRVFIIILTIFIATYIPATIMIYILQYCPHCDCTFRHYLRDFEFLLICLNSCLNPFIYILRFKPFRQSTQHIYLKVKQGLLNQQKYSDGGDGVVGNSNTQLSNLSNAALKYENAEMETKTKDWKVAIHFELQSCGKFITPETQVRRNVLIALHCEIAGKLILVKYNTLKMLYWICEVLRHCACFSAFDILLGLSDVIILLVACFRKHQNIFTPEIQNLFTSLNMVVQRAAFIASLFDEEDEKERRRNRIRTRPWIVKRQQYEGILDVSMPIIKELRIEYLTTPNTEYAWLDISNKFFLCWSFPNGIGAIDGKHIVIKKPSHFCSHYRNYKGTDSIVLMVSGEKMSRMTCNGVWAPKGLSIFTATSSVFLSLVTSIGNALIVVVVVKDPLRKLRSPFLYFIVNLAISDLIVGVITMPISVYTHTIESLRILGNDTVQVFHMSFFISVTASILNLIALSVDRYVAITFPLKYRKYLSWRRCWAISAGIWLFSLTVPFAYIKIGFIDYLMVFANSGIVVALIILVVTYLRIYKFLRVQTRNMKKQLRTTSTAAEEFLLKRLIMEKKVTRVFIIVLVLFIVTYVPATIMIYILQYCPDCDCTFRHYLRDLEFLLIAFNSCMNPFVYTMRFKPFRQSIGCIYRSFKRLFIKDIQKPHSSSVINSNNVQLTSASAKTEVTT
ncbi:uncharacterized protein LOC130642243 [Hydractinia symbiolongicarpus]|uniref:uncharacterized protein LOC130642243 n=1 Tax=Hydractinia symbiolongicarpus TaxID=13093 RepID=UPI002550A928|nr:uncharacterized protein LOC130642243 [Hydractinia symbiolongicarpus]